MGNQIVADERERFDSETASEASPTEASSAVRKHAAPVQKGAPVARSAARRANLEVSTDGQGPWYAAPRRSGGEYGDAGDSGDEAPHSPTTAIDEVCVGACVSEAGLRRVAELNAKYCARLRESGRLERRLRAGAPGARASEPLRGDGAEPSIACGCTRAELARHASRRDCWVALQGMVYDVTDFLHDHPGGDHVLLDHAGADGTAAFVLQAHSTRALAQMADFLVGPLLPPEYDD